MLQYISGLKALWRGVFGDSDAVIDTFFDIWGADAHCVCLDSYGAAAVPGGGIAAMGFLLPVGRINGTGCGMIYAIATDAYSRGRGLGAHVTNELINIAREHEMTAVLRPANRSLFRYYTEKTALKPAFRCMSASVWGIDQSESPIQKVDEQTYNAAREKALAQVEHISYNEQTLRWFTVLGGELYAYEDLCAAVEKRPGQAFCAELLAAEPIAAMKIISAAVKRSHVTARFLDKNGRSFGMSNAHSEGWYGLAFE